MRSPAIRGSHPNGPYQKLVVWTQLITERRKSAEGSIPLRPTTIFVNVRECSVIAISPCFIRFRTGHYTTSCAISARAATPHRCRFGLMPQTLSRRAEHSLTFIEDMNMLLPLSRMVRSIICWLRGHVYDVRFYRQWRIRKSVGQMHYWVYVTCHTCDRCGKKTHPMERKEHEKFIKQHGDKP